jgi:hypothetical protein
VSREEKAMPGKLVNSLIFGISIAPHLAYGRIHKRFNLFMLLNQYVLPDKLHTGNTLSMPVFRSGAQYRGLATVITTGLQEFPPWKKKSTKK